jgi:hypothetical protein
MGDSQVLVDGVHYIRKNGYAATTGIDSGTFVTLRSCVFFPEANADLLILREIDDFSFPKSSVQSMFIPRTLEAIGSRCFVACERLVSISFESDCLLREIGDYAFANCFSLASFEMPAHVDTISESLFYCCKRLRSVFFCQHSRLTTISLGAFCFCKSLRSIVLPETVREIHGAAFMAMEEVSISFESENCEFCAADGFVMTANRTELVRYFARNSSAVIPANVAVVGPSCFAGQMPLSSVVFRSNEALKRLEANAFDGCPSLAKVVIPRSVEYIGSQCFAQCRRLASVVFKSRSALNVIPVEAFSGCRALSKIRIPRSVVALELRCFSDCAALAQVAFENGSSLERIEGGAFGEAPVRDVELPAGVRSIAADAFPKATALRMAGEDDSIIRIFVEWNEARQAGSTQNFQYDPPSGCFGEIGKQWEHQGF